MKDNTNKLQNLAEELFSLMAVKATTEVSYDEANSAYLVNVDAGDENGLLIGKKGDTFSSLQTILGVLLKQHTGEWSHVVVNVANYREKEEEYLKNLAKTTAERAKSTGEPQSLYNLKAWQRRVVHMILSEDNSIETVSEGEGESRYLVVKNKK